MRLCSYMVNLKSLLRITAIVFLALAIIVLSVVLSAKHFSDLKDRKRLEKLSTLEPPEYVTKDYINIHDYARTGNKLDGINDIVIHYVGNPQTTAQNNRDYFNNPGTDVSSHFIVGLEGEIIECLPLDEISAASNHRNHDTISIEVCHPDETGEFNEITYAALLKLTAWLCSELDFSSENVIRHYDVTGKECPLYYVEKPYAWEKFLEDVDSEIASVKGKG